MDTCLETYSTKATSDVLKISCNWKLLYLIYAQAHESDLTSFHFNGLLQLKELHNSVFLNKGFNDQNEKGIESQIQNHIINEFNIIKKNAIDNQTK